MRKLAPLLPFAFVLISLPAQAVPGLETFAVNDVGIMGCQGAAGKRGIPSWNGPKFVAWDLADQNKRGTMTIKVNGQFTSFAYTMSSSSSSSVRMNGKLDRYNIDLFIDWSKKIGYESSGGNGSLRIYSGTPGDSQSYTITAVQGC